MFFHLTSILQLISLLSLSLTSTPTIARRARRGTTSKRARCNTRPNNKKRYNPVNSSKSVKPVNPMAAINEQPQGLTTSSDHEAKGASEEEESTIDESKNSTIDDVAEPKADSTKDDDAYFTAVTKARKSIKDNPDAPSLEQLHASERTIGRRPEIGRESLRDVDSNQPVLILSGILNAKFKKISDSTTAENESPKSTHTFGTKRRRSINGCLFVECTGEENTSVFVQGNDKGLLKITRTETLDGPEESADCITGSFDYTEPVKEVRKCTQQNNVIDAIILWRDKLGIANLSDAINKMPSKSGLFIGTHTFQFADDDQLSSVELSFDEELNGDFLDGMKSDGKDSPDAIESSTSAEKVDKKTETDRKTISAWSLRISESHALIFTHVVEVRNYGRPTETRTVLAHDDSQSRFGNGLLTEYVLRENLDDDAALQQILEFQNLQILESHGRFEQVRDSDAWLPRPVDLVDVASEIQGGNTYFLPGEVVGNMNIYRYVLHLMFEISSGEPMNLKSSLEYSSVGKKIPKDEESRIDSRLEYDGSGGGDYMRMRDGDSDEEDCGGLCKREMCVVQ